MDEARIGHPLSAILVADIVGYSRLIAADERSTFAAVRALRETLIIPRVAASGGRIIGSAEGSIVAAFGSAIDAVTAAVAIQKELADPPPGAPPERLMMLQTGIDLGEVGMEGNDFRGDAIYVAARLEQLADPGGLLISGAAYDQLGSRNKLPLDFVGEKILRDGEAPIRAYAVLIDQCPAVRPIVARLSRLVRPISAPRRLIPIAAALLVVAIAAAGAGAYRLWPRPQVTLPLAERPSIAVLPFRDLSVSLSDDAASARLAAGFSDDIIDTLARYRNLDVIAHESVALYAGIGVDLGAAARRLNVQNVLQGSFQRLGDTIHVSAEVSAEPDGKVLWSEQYNRPLTDIFAVETEIAGHAVEAIAGGRVSSMTPAAAEKPPGDLQAYDLVLLAQQSLLKGREADTLTGIGLAEQAIARDPDFARAYVAKAALVEDLAKYRKTWSEATHEMEGLLRTAVRLDPGNADAHMLLAWTLNTLGGTAEAQSERERALTLAPSSADIVNNAAEAMSFLGRPREGARMCDRSFRLNPSAPDWYYSNCVADLYFAGRYEEAMKAVDRGAAASEPTPPMLVLKAASDAELGHTDAAKATVAGLQSLYWEVSFEWLLNTGWNFERAKDQNQLLASAKKAGLRICATADELAQFDSPKRLPECAAQTSG